MRILDFGCGNKKIQRENAVVVGVDNNTESDADVIHDLNQFPYPFENDSFDEVVCFDVLEHLVDIPKVMAEIYRLSKKGAVIKIRTPHFSSPYAAMDPTHCHHFSVFSFDIFCRNRKIIPHNFTNNFFVLTKRKIIFPKLTRIVLAPLTFLFNQYALRYEQYLTFIFQAENIYLELEVEK